MFDQVGETLNGWAGITIALTALSAFLGGVWRFVLIPLRNTYLKINTTYRNLNSVVERFEGLELDVKQIKKEVMPENGKSLREELRDTASGVVQLQAMFRANTELTSDASIICDATGEVDVVTAGYTNLTGLNTREAMHGGWERCIHTEDLADVRENWSNALENKRTYVDDFRFVHVVTGKVTRVHVESRPVRLNNGHLVGYAVRIKPLKDHPRTE